MAAPHLSPSSPQVILTEEFHRCLAKVESGDNLFITGKAGTGKSTLLRLIREHMRDKAVAVVAPTGVAALNVDGSTIHSHFAFSPKLTTEMEDYWAPPHLAGMDILIIDEVSMVRADWMDIVSTALQRACRSRKPFGGIQVVMIGDLFQLPPVSEEVRDAYYATDFFFSSKAFLESQITTIELTHVFRQKDAAFIDVLNAIRDGTATQVHLDRLNARHDPSYQHSFDLSVRRSNQRCMTIATTHAYVDKINTRHLAGIPATETVSVAVCRGQIEDTKFEALQELRLKPGAQVMMLVNQDGYANGTVAEVLSANPQEVVVYLPENDEEKVVQRHTWEILKPVRKGGKIEKRVVGTFQQFPMQLAWAVTVHKSQGKTFDRVVFDCKRIFEDGQTYVALSRCTSLEGLTLTQPIEPRHIKVSPSVSRFYRSATRTRVPIMSGPIVFVGLHKTGLDKHRKLVEIGLIRMHNGEECFRISTLIAPGRDASEAASVGISASDLTMCPCIEEARDLIGLAIDGASLVGCHVNDLLSLTNWPDGVVDEGVPFDFGEIPFGKGEKPTALELAEQAMVDFNRLPISHRNGIQGVPFRFLSATISAGSYLYSRVPNQGVRWLLASEAFRRLEPGSQSDAYLGMSLSHLSAATAGMTEEPIRIHDRPAVSRASVELMRTRLRTKAERDQRVSKEEAAFINRFCEAFDLATEATVVESDTRRTAQFRSGMRIYLSGGPGKAGTPCEGMSKDDVKERCGNAGVIFLADFLKKDSPDALVVADLSTEGKKCGSAYRWRIPVMSWEELLEWADAQ